MKRTKFDETSDDQAAAPARPRTLCTASGCPLAGALSDGAGAPGFCGHHWGQPADQWRGITDLLVGRHAPLVAEINTARRFHAEPPRRAESSAEGLHEAWTRLRSHGYEALDPLTCAPVSYRHWAQMCETVLGRLVRGGTAALPRRAEPSVPAAMSAAEALAAMPVALPKAIPLPTPRRRDAEAEYADLPPVELP